MSTQPKSYKKLAGVGVLVIFLVVFSLPIIPVTYEVTEPRQKTETYTEREPYQVTKTDSKLLIDDKPTVPARRYVWYRIYIDVSGKERNIVLGSVIETAGYDINFYVFDVKGFNTWKEGKFAPAYVRAERIESYSYSFVPDHSGYYFFVLDNRYSWFTNKVPRITASWSYQITITEYRDVEKTRTVIEYVKVTKTKYVSLFQLLTGTG